MAESPDAGWLYRFTATLGPQMDYYEPPFVGHDDPIFVMRTRPGVIFDDDFWEVFHRFPFKICHVAYYGPARSQDDVLGTTMHLGVFELRWTTATPVWAGDNQAWPDSRLVDALEQIIHARLVVGEGVRGAARSVLAALAAAGTEVPR